MRSTCCGGTWSACRRTTQGTKSGSDRVGAAGEHERPCDRMLSGRASTVGRHEIVKRLRIDHSAEAWDTREGATMILLRRLLGDVLRRQRQRQGRTLREVSAVARVSLG